MKSTPKKIISVALILALIFSFSTVSVATPPHPAPQITSIETMLLYYNNVEMDSYTRGQVIQLIQQFATDEIFIKHYDDSPLDALNNLQYSINDLIAPPKVSPFGYESNLYYTRPAVRLSIQDYNNWCGATSAMMVLRQQGVSKTQKAIADEMKLSYGDGEGAFVYQIVNAINKWKKNSYRWVLSNSSNFSSYLSNSLYNDDPVILQVYNRQFYTRVLGTVHGNYYLSSDKHYIVVDSFDTVSGNIRVQDCNLNVYRNQPHGGTYNININHLKNMLSADHIIIGV